MMPGLLAAVFLGCAASEPRLELVASVVSPDGAGFEIVAYEPTSRTLWCTRSDRPRLTRFDCSNPESLQELGDIDLGQYGSAVTSVAAHEGLIAAVVLAQRSTDPGTLLLMDTSGEVLATSPTGAHPDMVTFTPDGTMLLVANEGESSGDIDPDGSVSVYEVNADADPARLQRHHIVELGDPSATPDDVTWLTPLARTPPSMVEPEFIACSPSGLTAFVSCQENNGIAVIDLTAWPARLTGQIDLGVLDHRDNSPIDIDRNGILLPTHSDVRSMPQPDGLVAVDMPDGIVLVTADEGDPRDHWGRDGVADLEGVERTTESQHKSFPVVFGSRGISLWTANGTRLSESVSIEAWLGKNAPSWPNQAARVDKRSLKRGSEPEGIVAWTAGEEAFAAVGFELAGAVGLFRLGSSDIDLLDVAVLQPVDDRFPAPEGLAILGPVEDSGNVYVAVADESAGTLSVLCVTTSGRSSGSSRQAR